MSEIRFPHGRIVCNQENLSFFKASDSKPQWRLNKNQILQLLVIINRELFGGIDQRRGFRIPVQQASNLNVTIQSKEGQPQRVCPIDISFSGIHVVFEQEIPDYQLEQEVSITLKYGDHQCHILGIVARRDRNHYGIFFPESVNCWEIAPPQELFDIVNLLEQQWLSTKTV